MRDALRGDSQGLAAYQALRDEVLARSAAGRRYTALYEKHAPEVARILAADPVLAARAAALLRQWQPAVKQHGKRLAEPLHDPPIAQSPIPRVRPTLDKAHPRPR